MRTTHDSDCSIYESLDNGNPESGICICGYGLQKSRQGDDSEKYSAELRSEWIDGLEGLVFGESDDGGLN